MCTYLTQTAELQASGLLPGADRWSTFSRAVVSYDHPVEAPVDHAVCIDLRSPDGDPSQHVLLELDASSARALAQAILATLEAPEARELEAPTVS